MNNVNEQLHAFVALNLSEFYKFSGKSNFKILTRTMHGLVIISLNCTTNYMNEQNNYTIGEILTFPLYVSKYSYISLDATIKFNYVRKDE